MWLLLIICLLLAIVLVLRRGRKPPLGAATVIFIHEGITEIRRGRLQPQTRDQVRHIIQDAGLLNGFIAVMPDGRVRFSREIPPSTHQRFRNVLMNQW